MFGEKTNSRASCLALVRMFGFSDVGFLAIIRDADSDADAAFDGVRKVLRETVGTTRPDESVFRRQSPDRDLHHVR